MILSHDGRPTPPSDVSRRLAEIHPRLGIQVTAIPGAGVTSHWWSFTLRWAPEDPRWGMIQQGVMSPSDAYDIIGQLPRDAGVDEAYGYFVQAAKAIRSPADREAILSRAAQWLEEPFEQMKAEQVALVEEAAGDLYRGHFVSTAAEAAKPVVAEGPIKRKAGRPKGSKSWHTKIREAQK